MTSIPDSTLRALVDNLKSSEIFTPSSEGYQDSIRRWSETGIKQAVWVFSRFPTYVSLVEKVVLSEACRVLW